MEFVTDMLATTYIQATITLTLSHLIDIISFVSASSVSTPSHSTKNSQSFRGSNLLVNRAEENETPLCFANTFVYLVMCDRHCGTSLV
jgi:hypothetical protein